MASRNEHAVFTKSLSPLARLARLARRSPSLSFSPFAEAVGPLRVTAGRSEAALRAVSSPVCGWLPTRRERDTTARADSESRTCNGCHQLNRECPKRRDPSVVQLIGCMVLKNEGGFANRVYDQDWADFGGANEGA